MDAPDIFAKTSRHRRMADLHALRALDADPFHAELNPDPGLEPFEVLHGGRRVIMFGSNDYLGLTRAAPVVEAARSAARRFGAGCSGSRLLNGTMAIHLELERELASFLGKESTMLFSTGYQTNFAVVAALAGMRDAVIADEYCHDSLSAGMRLAYARKARFRHNDLESLEEALGACAPDEGRLVLAEGVYSIGGDLAPLPGALELCRRHKAGMLLDDAHGLGVLGAGGRGTAEHFGLVGQPDIVTGTFSKSLASVGGFAAGGREVIDYLRHAAGGYVFSASLPPPATAAARAALEIVKTEPERRRKLLELSRFCRNALRQAGFDVPDFPTPLLAVRLQSGGDLREAALLTARFARALLEEGYCVNGILGPAASEPQLRLSITAIHNEELIAGLVRAMVKVARRLNAPLAR